MSSMLPSNGAREPNRTCFDAAGGRYGALCSPVRTIVNEENKIDEPSADRAELEFQRADDSALAKFVADRLTTTYSIGVIIGQERSIAFPRRGRRRVRAEVLEVVEYPTVEEVAIAIDGLLEEFRRAENPVRHEKHETS